ncbi:MAG: dTMP kinase [Sedimentisphaerales bacterium]|nr:dTMP kinase [Sedimentisphaerales bacterium]
MNVERLRGKFIVLDGPDGSGKSTQIKILKEVIENHGVGVTIVRDPGGTAIGDKIREILLDNAHGEMGVACEVLLYMASRAQLWAEKIAPALAEGRCVLGDRWLSSTLAYQGVAGKIGQERIEQIATAALEQVWPDLTVILDLPAETGLRRIERGLDRMEGKGVAFHQKVREGYLALAANRADFRVLEASGDVKIVAAKLVKVIEDYVAG